MKTIQQPREKKLEKVIIDTRLDELDKVVLFPDKVEKARQTIKKIGLPKKTGPHK